MKRQKKSYNNIRRARERQLNTSLHMIELATTETLGKKPKEETSIYITPRILREWFCNEMRMLGVQDRYIDAFCGRVPEAYLPDTTQIIVQREENIR